MSDAIYILADQWDTATKVGISHVYCRENVVYQSFVYLVTNKHIIVRSLSTRCLIIVKCSVGSMYTSPKHVFDIGQLILLIFAVHLGTHLYLHFITYLAKNRLVSVWYSEIHAQQRSDLYETIRNMDTFCNNSVNLQRHRMFVKQPVQAKTNHQNSALLIFRVCVCVCVCVGGGDPKTGGFHSQRVSNTESISMQWTSCTCIFHMLWWIGFSKLNDLFSGKTADVKSSCSLCESQLLFHFQCTR